METYATLAEADAAAESIGRARSAAILHDDAEIAAAFDLTPAEETAIVTHTARLLMPHVECLVLSTLAGPVERWYLTANRLNAPISPADEGGHTHTWPGGGHYHTVTEPREGGGHVEPTQEAGRTGNA